jgi:hypothetical protein
LRTRTTEDSKRVPRLDGKEKAVSREKVTLLPTEEEESHEPMEKNPRKASCHPGNPMHLPNH